MQKLNLEIIERAKKVKLREMEKELQGMFIGVGNGERVECPFCHYISKNKRFSGKVFMNGYNKSFKCFSCGTWRKL